MNSSLYGLRVAVQGLGHVGGQLGSLLARAGAHVLVADLDPRRVEAARSQYAATAIAVDDVVQADVDVFVPCAAGGVITEENVGDLKARAVVPAANNTLSADELAETLAARDVIYVPDFVANAGGLMACDADVCGTTDRLSTRVNGIAHTVATGSTPRLAPEPPRCRLRWTSPANASPLAAHSDPGFRPRPPETPAVDR